MMHLIWIGVLTIMGFTGPKSTDVLIRLEPLDFHQHLDDMYLRQVGQLESDGNFIYIRGPEHPEVIVISPDGQVHARIGGKGGGPNEFGDIGVGAIALAEGELWGMDFYQTHLRRFRGERLLGDFPVESANAQLFIPAANDFAVGEDSVVIPAHPSSGHLAAVYNFDGRLLRRVGELLPFDDELNRHVRGMNDTFWSADGDGWVSLHKFFPMITRFDANFAVTGQWSLDSSVLNDGWSRIQKFRPTQKMRAHPPLINDFQIHGGYYWLMSGGVLHQIDPGHGEVLKRYRFTGEGDDFASATGPHLTLFFFTFLDDDRLVLAHPLRLWNHDLWLATLPDF